MFANGQMTAEKRSQSFLPQTPIFKEKSIKYGGGTLLIQRIDIPPHTLDADDPTSSVVKGCLVSFLEDLKIYYTFSLIRICVFHEY